jgi:hypothetical protein
MAKSAVQQTASEHSAAKHGLDNAASLYT